MLPSLVYQVISGLFSLLTFALWARIILSWIPHDRDNPIIEILYKFTDPLLQPFQQLVPPEKLNGLDLSPIFAFMALYFLEALLVSILFG